MLGPSSGSALVSGSFINRCGISMTTRLGSTEGKEADCSLFLSPPIECLILHCRLPHLFKLRLCLFKNGNVRVGVFPKRKEIPIRSLSLLGVALQSVGAGESKMGQRRRRTILDEPAVVNNFLKLRGGGCALATGEVSLRHECKLDGCRNN